MRSYSIIFFSWALGLLSAAFSQTLPYNPTSILRDPRTKNLAYILHRISSSSNHQLVSLDLSSTLSTSNISFNIISQNLPFSNGDQTALIPTISDKGDLSIYTGFCASPETSALWKYHIPSPGSKVTASWAQGAIHNAADLTSTSLPRINFLTRAITFSTLVDRNSSQTNTYVFGGMCPKENATTATWQSAAHYSNQMLRISPISDLNYTIDITSSRSSAVAEAGFSFTGLTPTYLNTSNITTQKKSFVIIGGHTQNAFISMGQVAIWSLPEEAWNFVKVKMPLAIKPNLQAPVDDTTSLTDSRSGHTAVLTEDGSKIIVFGGWVGDIGRAAEPQLIILSLGTGYGGSGEWEWSIPPNQPSGNGVYGHGATMLPGNVMMIVGGSEISTNMKRNTDTGIKTMFFNATSLTWTSNYTNPDFLSKGSIRQGTSSLGIRIAVGLGLAAIAGIVLICVGIKRHKKRKTQRENNLRGLSEIATNSNQDPHPEMRTTDNGMFPWSNHIGWNHGIEEYEDDSDLDNRRSSGRYDNLDAGVYGLDNSVYILPSSKQTTHRSSSSSPYARSRGVYQSGNFENSNPFGTNIRTACTIHPIYEADENDEEEDNCGDLGVIPGQSASDQEGVINKRHSDPFKDPQIQRTSSNHRSVSQSIKTPESDSVAYERDIKDWVTNWAEADLMSTQSRTQSGTQSRSQSTIGHVSPIQQNSGLNPCNLESVTGEEDGCSVSNFSEHTEKSQTASVFVAHTAASTSTRSDSLRSFITGINPFSSSNSSPTNVRGTTVGSIRNIPANSEGATVPIPPSHGIAPGSIHSSHSAKSYLSAQTSVHVTPNEDEHLLSQSSDQITTGNISFHEQQGISSGSPSKFKSQSLRTGHAGWFGSLKRVFTSASAEDPFPSSPYNPGGQNTEIGQSSASIKKIEYNGEPRRTVSAGGTLWRRKQGKSDWEDSSLNLPGTTSGSSSSSSSSSSGQTRKSVEGGEEDWDIERAVENRLVQVMFTVPKERLRVVNQDVLEEKNEASSFKSAKALLRSSIKDMSQKMKSEKMEDKTEALVDYTDEEIGSQGKGKQKVGSYGSNPSTPVSSHNQFEDGDLSLPIDNKQKTPDNRSVASSTTSKSTNRKSRVLEIVERMESQL